MKKGQNQEGAINPAKNNKAYVKLSACLKGGKANGRKAKERVLKRVHV